MQLKRRISTAVLLSVILPAILLAPFHQHGQPSEDSSPCDACEQHRPHQGHLTSRSGTDDCLICQLLAQQFIPSSASPDCAPQPDSQGDFRSVPAELPLFSNNLSSPRAPPVPFCFC